MHSHIFRRRFFKAIILLAFVTGVSGFLDFTCFSAKPRIDINGDANMFIGGYKSGSDTGATVTFGRTSNTGTFSGLPPGSSQRDHGHVSARLLDMPQSGGVNRIGSFYCNADMNGVIERIPTIIMSAASVVRPREMSQTVSVGESVTFAVDKNADVPSLRWRHNGGDLIESLHDKNQYTIPSVTTGDAGVYECHQNLIRGQGIHAIFLLVVRACPSGKWLPPGCNLYCPKCLNGAICDERSGRCVCAPGFKGTHCEEAVGRNHWAQDGELICSSSNVYACRGKLLCLPHPYGCSCAAGYKGLDCNEDCSPGTYGASCLSQCHCKSSASCAADTGVCNGQCQDGWSGVNCQQRCSATPDLVTGLTSTTTGNTIEITWEPDDSVCFRKYYKVEYAVTNHGQCGYVTNHQLITAGQTTSTSYTIQRLYYYSTYIVYVSTVLNDTFTGAIASATRQTTATNVPNFKPTVTSSAEKAFNGLLFSWDNAPCTLIHGPGLQYEYQFVDNANIIASGRTTGTTTSVHFNDLIECKEYSFHVRTTNDIGEGEWSDLATISTRIIRPGPVNMIDAAQGTSPTELHVTWQATSESNCAETRYNINYTLLVQDNCLETNGLPMVATGYSNNNNDGFEATIENLIPYSIYNVSISAVNNAGQGEMSLGTQTTNMLAPTGPRDVKAIDVTSNTITFQWSEPQCGQRRGDIIGYSFRLINDMGEIVTQNMTSATVLLIANLSPFTNYSFIIAAVTAKGVGPDQILMQATAEAVPSKPLDLNAVGVTRNSIVITWQAPRYQKGIINKYLILYFVIAKPYDLSFSPNLQSAIQHFVNEDDVQHFVHNDDNRLSFTIEDLLPSTKYQIRVTPFSDAGQGDNAIAEQFTLPANKTDMAPPDILSFAKNIGKITSSTISIQIPETESEFATGYQIGVKLQTKCTCDKQLAQADDFGHYSKTPNVYVAGEILKDDVTRNSEFIIGDNNTYGSFYNPPLQLQATYTIHVGLISRINETTYGVSWSEGSDITLKGLPKDMAPTSFFPAFVVVSVLLFILSTISLTMAFKIRSMKIQLKEINGKTSVAETASKKLQVAGGQVVMSSDGYVEYKASQKEDSTYQDLGDDRSETQRGNEAEYAYVNESMIKESKTENDD